MVRYYVKIYIIFRGDQQHNTLSSSYSYAEVSERRPDRTQSVIQVRRLRGVMQPPGRPFFVKNIVYIGKHRFSRDHHPLLSGGHGMQAERYINGAGLLWIELWIEFTIHMNCEFMISVNSQFMWIANSCHRNFTKVNSLQFIKFCEGVNLIQFNSWIHNSWWIQNKIINSRWIHMDSRWFQDEFIKNEGYKTMELKYVDPM